MRLLFTLAGLLFTSLALADDWEISIRTADVQDAGTDAWIDLCLIELGEIINLDYPNEFLCDREVRKFDPPGDSFERNTTSTGFAKMSGLRRKNPFLVLRMQNYETGESPDWLVDSAIAINHTTGKRYVFLCEQWLEPKYGYHMLRCPGFERDFDLAGMGAEGLSPAEQDAGALEGARHAAHHMDWKKSLDGTLHEGGKIAFSTLFAVGVARFLRLPISEHRAAVLGAMAGAAYDNHIEPLVSPMEKAVIDWSVESFDSFKGSMENRWEETRGPYWHMGMLLMGYN